MKFNKEICILSKRIEYNITQLPEHPDGKKSKIENILYDVYELARINRLYGIVQFREKIIDLANEMTLTIQDDNS